MTTTTILGTSGNDTLLAAAGDTVGTSYYYNGDGGSDTITTGSGNDTVFIGYNSGHGLINLGSGTDSVVAAGELSAIAGGSQDTVNAGTGNDTIDFQAGGHVLFNGNTVAGSGGADSVYGYGDTTGHDTFIAGINSDTIVGSQAGNDSVVIGNNYHGNYYIDASGHITDGGNGDDVIVVGAGDVSVSNSTVSGGSFHDQIITYGNTDNVIDTNSGDDTVNTLSANDSITTGGGNNVVYDGTGGSETVNFHGGMNTLSYFYAGAPVNLDLSGAATIGSAHDAFSFSGTTFVQSIALSNAFNDTVTGVSSGHLEISAGSGNDLFNAGQYAPGLTHGDTLIAGSGQDTLSYADVGQAAGSVYAYANINLSAGVTAIGDMNESIQGFHYVVGTGSGNDTFTASATGNDTFMGGSGIDSITGGTGNDSINGGTGYDTIIANGGGDDTLIGGTAGGNLIDAINNTGNDSIIAARSNNSGGGPNCSCIITGSGNNIVEPGSDVAYAPYGYTSNDPYGYERYIDATVLLFGSGQNTLVINYADHGLTGNSGAVDGTTVIAFGTAGSSNPGSYGTVQGINWTTVGGTPSWIPGQDKIEFVGTQFTYGKIIETPLNDSGIVGLQIEPYVNGTPDPTHLVDLVGINTSTFHTSDIIWVS